MMFLAMTILESVNRITIPLQWFPLITTGVLHLALQQTVRYYINGSSIKLILKENNNIFPQVYFTKFMEELGTLQFQVLVLTPMSLVLAELPVTVI